MAIKITKPAAAPVVTRTLEDRLRMNEERGISEKMEKLAQADEELQKSAESAGEPAPPPRPAPKTSPSPYLGMPVLHRTQDRERRYNGSSVHPAVITHVWSSCVNLKVLPDCGAPYDATSQQRIAYADVDAQGWFTVDEARSA